MRAFFLLILNLVFMQQAIGVRLETIPTSIGFNSPATGWTLNNPSAGDYIVCGAADRTEIFNARDELIFDIDSKDNHMSLGAGKLYILPNKNGTSLSSVDFEYYVDFSGAEFCTVRVLSLPDADYIDIKANPVRSGQSIRIDIPDGASDNLAPGREIYINIPYKIKIYHAVPGTNVPGTLWSEKAVSIYRTFDKLIAKPWSGIELLSLSTMDCTDAEIGGTSQCGTIEIAPVNKPKWAELQASVVTPAGCSVDIQKGGTALGNGLYDFTADIRQAVADGKNITFEPSVTCTKAGKHVSTIQLDFTYP